MDIRSGEIAQRKLPGWDKEEYYRLMEEQGNNFRHPQSVVDEAFDAWVSRTLLDPDNTMSAKELRRTFRFNPLTEEIERADGQRFKPTDRRWKALEEVEGETLYAKKNATASHGEEGGGDAPVAGGRAAASEENRSMVPAPAGDQQAGDLVANPVFRSEGNQVSSPIAKENVSEKISHVQGTLSIH